MPSVVGENVESTGAWGKSASKGKDAGVSRLSVGFRHLMDWSRETPESIVTNPGRGYYNSNSSLTWKLHYNMTQGEASKLPGGGFPRAEAAIVTGLKAETPDQAGFQPSPAWFDKYVRQMEYAITEQSPGHLQGSRSNPGIPSRRWIYGTPNKPTRHGGGDIHQPVWEEIIKNQTKIGEAEGGGGPIGQIYTKIYMNMLKSLNKVQPKEMQNLIRFLMEQDKDSEEGLGGMGASMLKGMLKDLEPLDEKAQDLIAKDYGTEEKREATGVSSAKSRQELLAILSDIGLVVGTGHGQLGGSEPMDVLFHKEHTIKYPDPDDGPNKIKIRLADITEEDWTKPGHHGTGTGKKQTDTKKDILNHYNIDDGSGQGRIKNYNNLIKMIRRYVDITTKESGISGKRGGLGSDQHWDAWYRRRATQIASDLYTTSKTPEKITGEMKKGAPRTGTGAEARGRQDLLKLELNTWLATGDAWFTESMKAMEKVSTEDLKHVLHHMGSANAMYEFEQSKDELGKYDVNRDGYGEMIAFNQATDPPEEFTVIINFSMTKGGLVKKLAEADVAIVKQSLQALFMNFWSTILTPAQQYEAWDLLTTVSGMTTFTSYFAETAGVATAAGKTAKRWTVRADAAIPGYMDDLMYMFFHGGNALMKKGMVNLLNDMDRIARAYSSTLRPKLWEKISSRWPTYAWGARHDKYGGGANTDRQYSDSKFPPKGFSLQEKLLGNSIFGDNNVFFPQEGEKDIETPDEYTGRTGFAEPWTLQEQGVGIQTADGRWRSPKRISVPAVHGKTDFEAASIHLSGNTASTHAQYSGRWWTAGTPSWWTEDGRGMMSRQPTSQDPLEFVWAAPYATWQHYQMSGSVK